MADYNLIYKKYIDNAKDINFSQMSRNRFYVIKSYDYVDAPVITYSETESPIIYTLFVSKQKDIVHAVKITDVNPAAIKKFFVNLYDYDDEKMKLKGSLKTIYENLKRKVPQITSSAYRTYRLSGIKKVMELNFDLQKITPKNKPTTKNKKTK